MFENIVEICNTNPQLLAISASNEFYFQRSQDAINRWLNMVLTDEQNVSIIELSTDYEAFKNINADDLELYPIQQLLFEIISYCDIHANKKAHYNQYEDNRTIAKAGVRMGAWVKSLVDYKFNPQNVFGSTKNAFDYLVNPSENSTVLSEEHRKFIVEHYLREPYTPNSFTDDLKELFSGYNLTVLNSDNYTYYLSRLIYFYSQEWRPKANLTFKQLIEQLRNHFEKENVALTILEWKARQKYVWIADKQEIIGGYIAHYEVSSRTNGGKNIYVDIHFESQIKSEKDMFFDKIKVLPENLEWIDWQKCKSIGYKEVFTLDDDDILEKVTSALEYMEENIGDEIRQIINNLPPSETSDNSQNNSSNEMKHPLNQILYGPPGTGKTYNTINKALEIINDAEVQALIDWNDREKVKELFDRKVKEGQIVFTTFHQNMSYEDFIEGIKPKKSDDNDVYYEIEDGLFKIICETAKNHNNSNIVRSKNSLIVSSDFDNNNFFKLSLGEAKNPNDREIYDYCIENDLIAIGYGGLIDFTGLNNKEINEKWKVLHPKDSTTPSYMNYFINKVKKGDYIIVSNGNSTLRAIAKVTGDYYFMEDSPIRYNHFRKVEWLFHDNDINVFDIYNLKFSQSTLYSLKKNELKKSFFTEKTNESDIATNTQKNFVLIIDEINRGNVSKIFGELITLIEESKRTGKSEAITATLPYSKLEFSVPDNVYILGTMNTADRSVEALDTALRRRFDFTEMMPKYDLYKRNEMKYFLNGMFAFDILKTINDRLEVLLGRDHLIGHSFFILDESESIEPKVKSAFYKNIIPLLQEYFYGDYNKIGLVLGSGFVKKNEVAKAKELFANNREFGGDDYANNALTFEIIDYTDTLKYTTNAEFYFALNTLMNKTATSEENA